MYESPIIGHFRKDVERRRDAKGCGFCAFRGTTCRCVHFKREYGVLKIILPTQVTADNDIALVQLAEPVSLTPIRLNSNPCLTPPDVTGIPVSLLGWGATNDTDTSEQSPTLNLGLMQTFNTTLVWFFKPMGVLQVQLRHSMFISPHSAWRSSETPTTLSRTSHRRFVSRAPIQQAVRFHSQKSLCIASKSGLMIQLASIKEEQETTTWATHPRRRNAHVVRGRQWRPVLCG
jgi:hypothetical protein